MSSPARLHKVEDKTTMEKIDQVLMRYAHILLPILVVILIFLIIMVIVAIVNMSSTPNISVVESGNYYNHLKDVI